MKRLKQCIAILIATLMITCSLPISALANEIVEAPTSGKNESCSWEYNEATDTMCVYSVYLYSLQDGMLPLFDELNPDLYFDGSFSKLVFSDKLNTMEGISLSRDLYPDLKTVYFNPRAPLCEIQEELFCDSNVTEVNIVPNILKIGDYAFYNSRITEITIPANVAEIGSNAFAHCLNLKSVIFSNCASSQGLLLHDNLFMDCEKLTNVDMSTNYRWRAGADGYKSIPTGMFRGCTSLGDVVLPSQITQIGANAFERARLTSINLSNITRILFNAFASVRGYPNISLNSKVTYIEQQAFYDAQIGKLNMNQSYTIIPQMCFAGARCNEISSSALITEIGYRAFYNCNIKSFDFSKVTTIGDEAFSNSSIESVDFSTNSKLGYLGNSILGNSIFLNATRLSKVNLGDLMVIKPSMFRGCTSLGYVDISKVEEIDDYAFRYDTNATFSDFNSNLDFVGSSAFESTKIQRAMFDSKCGMDSIRTSVFRNCTELEQIVIPDDVSSIGTSAFEGCKKLKYADFPANIKSIGSYAFRYCDALEKIDLSFCRILNSVGSCTFSGCKLLKEVNLIETAITTIYTGCFSSCVSLNEITLPSNVNKINADAFLGCTNLKRITIQNANAAINADAFAKCTDDNSLITICGFTNSTAQSFAKTYGYTFDSMGLPEASESGTVNPNDLRGTWTNGEWYYNYTTKTLIVTGDGEFTDKLKYANGNSTTLDTVIRSKKPEKLIFDEGITSIPANLTSFNAIGFSLELPSTIEDIGEKAFFEAKITKLYMPNSVTQLHIGDYAFAKTQIASLILPNGEVTMGDHCFYYCYLLKSVTFGEGIKTVGDNAFNSCTALAEVTFSDSIKRIGKYAFYDTGKLISLTLPSELEYIDESAFQATGFKKITLPASLKEIGKKAFSDNAQLVTFHAKCKQAKVYYDANNPGDNAIAYLSSGTKSGKVTVYGMVHSEIYYYCQKANLTFVMECDDADRTGYITSEETVDTYNSATSFKWYYFADTKECYISGSGPVNGRYVFNMDGTKLEDKLDIRTLYIIDGITLLHTPLAQFNPQHIWLPESLNEIHENVFKNCNQLVRVDFPDSLTYLPSRPFQGCTSINTVTFGKGLRAIPIECFKDSTSLKYVDLGGASEIGARAFMRCPNLEEIVIPDTVVTIGEQAFFECLNVVSIKLGSSVNKILDRAFANIPFCDKIVVSSDILSISPRAFENIGISTSGLDIEYNDNISIANLNGLQQLNITSITVGENFKEFKEIVTIESLQEIHTTNSCKNYYVYNNCLYTNDNVLAFVPHSMSTVDIKPGTKAIGDKAFMKSKIHVIRIPDGVTTIGEQAFYGASELKSVRFPETLDRIGTSAFEGCSKLKTAYIPYPCKTIGKKAFKYCDQLASVILPDGLDVIETDAFNGCTSLESIVIPESVSLVDSGAFAFIPNFSDIYVWESELGYNCLKGSPNVRIHTLLGTSANAYARSEALAFTIYTDNELFFDDCMAAIDVLAGYLGYCAEGHGDIEWMSVYEGDCESDGYIIGVCEYCSQVLDERHITAQGHKYSEVGYVHETSTSAGIRVLKCTTCGEQFTTYTKPTSQNPEVQIHSVSGYVTADTGKANSYGNTSLKNVNVVINGMVVARTDKNGYFSFSIKSGTYVAELQYTYGFTRSVILVVEDEDIVVDEAIRIIAVDFNSDNRIDDADVALFRVIVSSKEGDTSYLDYVDINHDGYINAKDYMIIQQFKGADELTYTYDTLVIKKPAA